MCYWIWHLLLPSFTLMGWEILLSQMSGNEGIISVYYNSVSAFELFPLAMTAHHAVVHHQVNCWHVEVWESITVIHHCLLTSCLTGLVFSFLHIEELLVPFPTPSLMLFIVSVYLSPLQSSILSVVPAGSAAAAHKWSRWFKYDWPTLTSS